MSTELDRIIEGIVGARNWREMIDALRAAGVSQGGAAGLVNRCPLYAIREASTSLKGLAFDSRRKMVNSLGDAVWRRLSRNGKCKFRSDGIAGLRRLARKHLKDHCEVCGSTDDLVAHHLDRDKSNNTPENISTVCRRCHGFCGGTVNLEGTIAGGKAGLTHGRRVLAGRKGGIASGRARRAGAARRKK